MTAHLPNLLRRSCVYRAAPAAGLLLAACLLLSSLAAAAQYSIAGTVVNAQTGEPVAHANVAALTAEDSHALISVTADDAGHFALPGLPAAKYQLTASRRSFHTAFYDEHGDFSSAIVTGPGVTGHVLDTTHLVFRLPPNAVLYGLIRDDAGEPVAQASVLLFRKPASPAEHIAQAGSTTTDDTGAYDFGNLAAGQYLLAVKAEPWYALHPLPKQTPNPALDVAYPVTYYDSTTDENSATPVDLAPGARAEANLTLQAVPALHLEAEAERNQQGNVAQPAMRQLAFGTEIGAATSSFSDAAHPGLIEFSGVAPGHYAIDQGDPPRQAEIDATTSGTLDPSTGTPLVDVNGQLHAAALPAAISVVLTRTDNTGDRRPLLQPARNGAFHFQLPAGSAWQLAVANTGHPEANLTVLSVRAGAVSQPGDRFTVGSQPLALTAEVSAAATSVTGFARKGGKPFAGAMIVLLPRAPSAQNPQAYAAPAPAVFASLVRRDQSDSDGSFSLFGVVPGVYTVVAIQNGWDLDWTDPIAMSRFAPAGAAVTVPPDAAKTVSLSAPVAVESK